MCKSELSKFIFSGVVLPVVISIVVLLSEKLYHILIFMIIYKKLHKKTFQTYFKNDSGSSIIQEYKLKLHYDSVSYTGSNLLEPDSSFVGKIKFEPKMKGFGRGYSIKKINGKDDGFNFFTIFFEGDFTVAYQEAPYVKSPKEITQRAYIPEAFVWKEKKVDQKLSKIKKLKKSINA